MFLEEYGSAVHPVWSVEHGTEIPEGPFKHALHKRKVFLRLDLGEPQGTVRGLAHESFGRLAYGRARNGIEIVLDLRHEAAVGLLQGDPGRIHCVRNGAGRGGERGYERVDDAVALRAYRRKALRGECHGRIDAHAFRTLAAFLVLQALRHVVEAALEIDSLSLA